MSDPTKPSITDKFEDAVDKLDDKTAPFLDKHLGKIVAGVLVFIALAAIVHAVW